MGEKDWEPPTMWDDTSIRIELMSALLSNPEYAKLSQVSRRNLREESLKWVKEGK